MRNRTVLIMKKILYAVWLYKQVKDNHVAPSTSIYWLWFDEIF